MKKEKKLVIFLPVIYIIFLLPICLLIWIEMPWITAQDLEPFEWFGVRVFAILCYVPIFLAQAVLGGGWAYLFFRKKNRPALFWICCALMAVALILLVLHFMILYAIWRNNGWLCGIDIGSMIFR